MATERGAMAVARPTGWPRRFTLVLFFFTCALILYIDRVNISVVAPILTGLIVQYTGRWDLVFYLAAGISAVGEVIWLLFATGEPVFE